MNASGVGRDGSAPTNSANLYGGGDDGVCVCVCVCVREYVCVLEHTCARVHSCAFVMCLQYTIIIFNPG